MKRVLLAASAIIAVGSFAPRQAHALFGVGDVVFDPTVQATQLQSWAQQFAHNANEIDQFVRANSSLTGVLSSVSGATGVNMSGLNSVRSVLSDVGEVRSAVSGTLGTVNGTTGSFQGGAGSSFSLSGAANAILAQNTVYRPQGGDFMAQWLNARSSGQAAQQAYMNEFVRTAQVRQQALLELKQKQMQAKTTDERMAIQNEIGRTQEELSTQEQQARSLAALGEIQERVSQQQIMEKQRMDAENLSRATDSYAQRAGLPASWGQGSGGATLAAAAQPVMPQATTLAAIPTFNGSN